MTSPRLPGSPYAYERRRKSAEKGKNPAHYASVVTLKLTDNLDSILDYIASQTYRQPLINLKKQTPADIYKKNDNDADKVLERKTDGVQHAARVAVAAEAFFQLYQHYGNDEFHSDYDYIASLLPGDNEQKASLFIKLLTITAFYHDAARDAEGEDRAEWEENSAVDCQCMILELINNYETRQPDVLFFKKNAPSIAKFFADAIRNKYSTPIGAKPKNVIERLLHDADYIDDMRKSADSLLPRKRPFCVNELEFWQDSIGAYEDAQRSFIDDERRFEAQNTLMRFIFEWRNVINDSYDLQTSAPIEMLLPAKNAKIETVTLSEGVKYHFNKKEKEKFEYHKRPLTYLRIKLNTEKYPCLFSILNQEIDDNDAPMAKMSDKPDYMPFRFAYYHLASYLDKVADQRLIAAGSPDDPSKIAKVIAVEKIIADAMQTLCKAVGDETVDQPSKIEAVKEFHRVTDPLLEGRNANLKAAITFFAVAALSVILGATLGLVIGIATGAIAAGPIGAIAGGLIGMLAGGVKGGVATGCFAAGALGLSALGAKVAHYKTRHTFFNTHVNMLADYAEKIALSPKVAAA